MQTKHIAIFFILLSCVLGYKLTMNYFNDQLDADINYMNERDKVQKEVFKLKKHSRALREQNDFYTIAK